MLKHKLTTQALWFNRHTVSQSSPPLSILSFIFFSPTCLSLSHLLCFILLTNQDLLNEALTKSELMNYSNTYDVMIVINRP